MMPECPRPADAAREGEPTLRRLVLVGKQPTAEEALYQRLLPVVTRLIWTFAGADRDRDDLVHDVFVRLLRGSARLRDPERLEAWAVRVTMNSVKNEFRRRKLRRWFALDAPDVNEPRCHPDFDGREVLRHTYAVLERLSTPERLVLSLRLFEEASIERIATVCACSERTAKRRLRSARERFVRMAERDPLLAPRLTSPPRDVDG